jgi:hypothetical protein
VELAKLAEVGITFDGCAVGIVAIEHWKSGESLKRPHANYWRARNSQSCEIVRGYVSGYSC